MNNLTICPICLNPLELDDSFANTKVYLCNRNISESHPEHNFIIQLLNQQPKMMKIKFKENNKKIFLKLDFLHNKAFLWTKPGDPYPHKIPIFIPDFSDIPKLIKKLKTLLVFV